jgi:hypothetical protein
MRTRITAAVTTAAAVALGGAATETAVASWGVSASGTATVTASNWARLTAPAGFTLTVTSCHGKSGTGTAAASWQPVNGAAGYQVETGGNAVFSPPAFETTTTTSITGLPITGGVLYARVQATPGGPYTNTQSVSCPTS